MRKLPLLQRLAAIGGTLIALLAWPACSTTHQPVPEAEKSPQVSTLSKRHTLRIATFNIQDLGTTKLAKPAIMAELAALIRKYDIVAVQEIDDRTLRTPAAFLQIINAMPGPRYDKIVSALSGRTATAGQDEQYAFFYNTEKVMPYGAADLYPDPQDLFIREPFAAQFRPWNSRESVVLLTVHTQATKEGAAREIAALKPAATWAEEHFADEVGVIVLGDFNAGETYLRPAQVEAIRKAHLPHRWIVPDNADTTITARKDQAHDRIVLIGSALEKRFTGDWGVDRTVSGKDVSDHLPVWADFWFAGNN